MSLRLIMVLEKDIPAATLDKMRAEYELSLIKINNATLRPSLRADEEAYQVSEYGVDDTGIGTLSFFKKAEARLSDNLDRMIELCGDNQAMIKSTKETWGDEFFIKLKPLIKEKRIFLRNDLKNWVRIISGLINSYKLKKVGIAYVMADNVSDKNIFNDLNRQVEDKNNIMLKHLISLGWEVILMYE